MSQRIGEEIRILATVEPEHHFVEVSGKMLDAHAMPRSHDSALEERERGFHGVRVNVARNVLARVINRLVEFLVIRAESPRIDCGFVGDDHFDIFAHVLRNDLFDFFRGRLVDADEPQFSAALANADDDLFLFAWQTAPRLSADVGFVNLDHAVQHRFLTFDHRGADAMAEVPRRAITSDSERALNLAGRYALLRLAEQECCDEPVDKWKMRVVEYSASGDGKLVIAGFAVEQLLVGFEFDCFAFAADASRAFREAQANEQFAALVIGRKGFVEVN